MNKLLEKRAALIAESQKDETTEERFNAIVKEVERIDKQILMIKSQEEQERGAQQDESKNRGARVPMQNGTIVDQTTNERTAMTDEEIEQRNKLLRQGGSVKFEERAVTAITTNGMVFNSVASSTIAPTFAQVGSIDEMVTKVILHGAESYKKAFEKNDGGEAEIGKEGVAPANSINPQFGYAQITKIKLVAYAEITKEVEKLPAAQYVAYVENAVKNALKKKRIQQIINGRGSAGTSLNSSSDDEMIGIINAPTSIIEASQTKTIASITENTLNDIIFAYGGAEEVEGDAVLIMNKLTLQKFTEVKGVDKREAYNIVVGAKGGSINGVPVIYSAQLPAWGNVANGKPYMLYGKLSAYEMAEFSPIDCAKSTDYKFKEGMICYRAEQYVGGSPCAFNCFMKIIKAAAAG